MREIFPREAADDPEPFTGERLTASVHGAVELEHYHRYLFSRGFCRDRDVLDIACGEGALRVTALQRSGGKRITAADYLNAMKTRGA